MKMAVGVAIPVVGRRSASLWARGYVHAIALPLELGNRIVHTTVPLSSINHSVVASADSWRCINRMADTGACGAARWQASG